MNHKLFAAALAALAVPALLSTTATAQETRATHVTLRDGVGDVWAAPLGGDTYRPAPAQRVGDLVRMQVEHRHNAVTVRLVFADLRRTAAADYEFGFRTDRATRYAQVSAGRQHWGGRHHLWTGAGDVVDCDAMSHVVDYDTNVVTLRIPRSCLGDPAWVRVLNYDQRETSTKLFEDNPHNHEAQPGGFTRRLYRA